MEISLKELQECTQDIFEAILEVHGKDSKVNIQEDYYWAINSEQVYSIQSEPSSFNLGSLSDDLEKVKSITSKKNDPVCYNLKNIASIMNYIAQNESLIK